MSGCTGNTPSVALTIDTSGTLTADVKESSDAGNAVEEHTDGIWVPGAYGVIAIRSTDQVIDNAAPELVHWTGDYYSADGAMHDPAGGAGPTDNRRIVCVRPGIYGVFATGEFASVAGGNRRARLQKTLADGSASHYFGLWNDSAPDGASNSAWNVFGYERLAAGDYLTVELYQNSGGGINLIASTITARFGAFMLGAT